MGDRLDLVSIAVGHGDATLIHWQPASGTSFAMLVDGGPRGSGARIKRVLADRGIMRLDIVVLTHVDADHVDGLLEIADDVEVALYLGPCVRAFERHAWLFPARVLKAIKKAAELEQRLAARGAEIRYPVEGYSPLSCDNRVKVRVLSPAGRYLERLLLDDDTLELFSTFPVPQGWLLVDPPPTPDEQPSRRTLRQTLRTETSISGADVAFVERADATFSDIDGLWNDVMSTAQLEPEFFGNPVLNDTSIVLQLDVFLDNSLRRRILLAGDLENWAYLLGKHSSGLDTDVLKASHHGGYVYVEKQPADFDSVYQWLRPTAVLVSASGQHNRKSSPSPVLNPMPAGLAPPGSRSDFGASIRSPTCCSAQPFTSSCGIGATSPRIAASTTRRRYTRGSMPTSFAVSTSV